MAWKLQQKYILDLRPRFVQDAEAKQLQMKIDNMQQQLREAHSSCSAAEAAVIELMPLHLTVSQLRKRLAAEMRVFAQLQVHCFQLWVQYTPALCVILNGPCGRVLEDVEFLIFCLSSWICIHTEHCAIIRCAGTACGNCSKR